MNRRKRLLIGGGVVVALAAGGVGYAQAGGDDENVTGPDAQRAKGAAEAVAGGGRAVSVEREDEGGAAWEVEVQRDGKTVEVKLTDQLKRSSVETDDDSGNEADEREDGDED